MANNNCSNNQYFRWVVATLLFCFPSLAAGQSTGPFPVGSADELVRKWEPHQHLYIKGDLGIGRQQLQQLEAWLDANGPHWTIALFRSASDEVYRTLDNRSFHGMDAVEYGLGRGLALRTVFSSLTHPATGETDGAVFVLFLDERKFSYYASVAQDVRGLGESNWVGKLDGPAYRAMRGGGRILDAVKDTVTNINRRLEKQIAAEVEQQQRERNAKQRALANLQSDIATTRESVQEVEQAASTLKQQYPQADGELASPTTTKWRRQLADMQDELTADNVPAVLKRFETLSHEVESYLNSYAQADKLDDVVAPLEDRIAAIRANELAAGSPMADEATAAIKVARDTRARGGSGIAQAVQQATDSVAAGERAIEQEQQRIREAAEQEQQRIRAAEARRRLIRQTVIATAAVLAIAFAVVLFMLNRRRAPAKTEAIKAFVERDESVKQEMEKVYGLFERSGEILGSKEKVKKRGYEGKTKKLTDHTFEDVDDLLVMSGEVERVMDEAREMIHPQRTLGKITNLISSSRYERGVNRMSGEPLKFHRDKGLPLVIRRESEMTGEEPPEEISMTFDKVFEAFHGRTATAETTLNTIENSLLEVDDRLKHLQEQIETATEKDRKLAEMADDDGMLGLPSLFEKLLPSAQADFDEADEITATDPVQAIETQIPRGSRKITEALSFAEDVDRLRHEIFPKLNEYAPLLKELDYNTEWIQATVADLTKAANRHIERAIETTVAEEAAEFSNEVTAFGQRAARTLELARELKEDAVPSLAELGRNIAVARDEIAGALNLPSDQCLAERKENPDSNVEHARELLAAAQAALQHGGVDAATEARDALIREVEMAQDLVDGSLSMLHEFTACMDQRLEDLDNVQEKVPRHEELLADAQQRFDDSALVFQRADPSFEDPSANVATHLVGCRESIADAKDAIQKAESSKKLGRLIEAARRFESAQAHTLEAEQLLVDIGQHCSKLNEVSRANEGKLATMQRDAEALEPNINDRRTMQPTIREYQTVLREIDAAQHEISNTMPRDPFRDAAAIEEFTQKVVDLDAKIEADLDAHAEAKRAVEGAKAQLQTAQELVRRARNDGIPDNAATTQGVRSVEAYEVPVKNVQRRLDGQHDDWKVVDQEAVRINAELGVEAAKLRGELERATRSMHVFQSASDAVFEATRWTGGLGSRIFGSPGSKELERARLALQQGDYSVMAELARAAQIAAQHAIQRAQREVYRKQREQARREEEARRRRRRNSIQIGGGSSFPSGGRSRSSGGSRSSSGGVRSSSSGSGFSRSGW